QVLPRQAVRGSLRNSHLPARLEPPARAERSLRLRRDRERQRPGRPRRKFASAYHPDRPDPELWTWDRRRSRRHRPRRLCGEPAVGGTGMPELTILVFLPAVAAAFILLLPRSSEQYARWVALAASVAILAISVGMFFSFELH